MKLLPVVVVVLLLLLLMYVSIPFWQRKEERKKTMKNPDQRDLVRCKINDLKDVRGPISR